MHKLAVILHAKFSIHRFMLLLFMLFSFNAFALTCPEGYTSETAEVSDIETECFATISFESNGGSAVESKTFNYNSETQQFSLSEIPIPSRTDYGFVGWFNNAELSGNPITTQTQFTGSLTLYAKWGCPNGYTGTTSIITDPGTQCRTQCDHIVGKTVTSGYKYYNGDQSSCTYTGSVYTIRYVDEFGATLNTNNPTSWTYGANQIAELTAPELEEGMSFNGWFAENPRSKEGQVLTKITQLSDEYLDTLASNNATTITFYARVYPTPVFGLTTTNTNIFKVYFQNTAGTLWIDWGDGSVQRFDSSGGNIYITHNYSTSKIYEIAFSSHWTNYNLNSNTTNYPTYEKYISIYKNYMSERCVPSFSLSWRATPEKITNIWGSLGQLFPSLDDESLDWYHRHPNLCEVLANTPNLVSEIPEGFLKGIKGVTYMSFAALFNNSSIHGQIPEDLFSDIEYKNVTSYAFEYMFSDCPNLTGPIPSSLFNWVEGDVEPYVFRAVFKNTPGLTGKIPSDLFSGITGSISKGAFQETFMNATGLTESIDKDLFGNINSDISSYAFSKTFAGCTGLTGSIPEGLFAGMSGPMQENSFEGTFSGATGLTGQIPENLFGSVYGTSKNGFYETFKGATNLGKDENGEATSIPENLFINISGDVNTNNKMFVGTFADTQYLASPVPTELFKGITGYLSDNATGTRTSTYTSGGMTNIFNNSNIPTTCDDGQYQYLTGFEVDWNNRVACEVCPENFPTSISGDNVTINKCFTACDEDINGGTYVSGHKYWTEDGNGDSSSCVYQYNITYELFGGSNYSGAPTSYVYGTSATVNGVPTRSNSEFLGWCTDSTLENCDNSFTISLEDFGNKKFYAKWKTNAYTIQYVDENGSALTTTNPTTWVVDETIPFNLTDPEVPENWTFYAWFNNNTGFNNNTSATKITTITQDLIISLANGSNVVKIYGHKYPASVFWMTTTNMNDGEKFAFYVTNISGDVYINWDDGVVVKNPYDSNGYIQHIYHNNDSDNINKSYRIGLSSYNLSDYNTNDTVNADCSGTYHPTFWLGNVWNKDVWNQGTIKKLFKIEGNLSAVFPTMSNGAQPNFIGAFANCTNLEGTIPPELFANIKGQPRKSMFSELFYDCQKLSGNIPPNLFGGLTGTYTENLFSYAFYNTNLSGNIPSDIIDEETNEKHSGLFGKLSGAPKTCMFKGTFYSAKSLTGNIPEKLFGNLNGAPASYMFAYTFLGASNLTGPIPQGLFGNINGAPAPYMFAGTFRDITSLKGPIPERLFGNINGKPAENMFATTFNGCLSLNGTIPEGIFGNIYGDPAPYMFSNTFDGTALSGPLPQNLFKNISGNAQPWMYNRTFAVSPGLTGQLSDNFFGNITGPIQEYAFNRTFLGDSLLTGPIPENLFGTVSGTALRSFHETFKDATNIGKDENGNATTIPENLFANISGTVDSSNEMFARTFANTEYLTGPVPTELFKGVTGYLSDNAAGTRTSTYTSGGMTNIFANSNIAQVCPDNQYQYLTGFEVDWGNSENTEEHHVACEVCPENFPTSISGDNVTINKCFTACDEDINGGTFVSGHKYWSEDGNGNSSSCVYKYNITYELNYDDASLNETHPTEYTNNILENLIIPEPEHDEYINFDGWYDNELFEGDAISEISVGSVGDKKLYAKWTREQFNIVYDYTNGGSGCENEQYYYGVEKDILCTPENTGYSFDGWFDDIENGNRIETIPNTSTGDITLYARWTKSQFNIIYDYTNGGSGCANEQYYYGTEKDIVCVPENTGYIFTGWFDTVNGGNHIESIPNTSMGDITLYAQWTPISYYIEYVLDGGTNYIGAPNAYNHGTETVINGIPTKKDFLFDGWCTDEELTECYETYTIPASAINKQKLYVKWVFNCETDKWFHIGDNPNDKICLSDTKPNGTSIVIRLSDGLYYIPLLNGDININENSSKKMHVFYLDNVYSAHDASVQ